VSTCRERLLLNSHLLCPNAPRQVRLQDLPSQRQQLDVPVHQHHRRLQRAHLLLLVVVVVVVGVVVVVVVVVMVEVLLVLLALLLPLLLLLLLPVLLLLTPLFQAELYQKEPSSCPAGKYTGSGRGNSSGVGCSACSAGYYSAVKAITCTACPVGTYAASAGVQKAVSAAGAAAAAAADFWCRCCCTDLPPSPPQDCTSCPSSATLELTSVHKDPPPSPRVCEFLK